MYADIMDEELLSVKAGAEGLKLVPIDLLNIKPTGSSPSHPQPLSAWADGGLVHARCCGQYSLQSSEALEESPRTRPSLLAWVVKRVAAQPEHWEEVVLQTGELPRRRHSYSDVTRHP